MLSKYILCLLLCFFLYPLQVISQESKFGFGMKTGYNSSKITGPWEKFFNSDNEISPLKHEGAHFGAYLEIPISNNLNFQPEFLITMKGTELNGPISGSIVVPPKTNNFTGIAAINYKLYYFQIPLILKYNFNTNFAIVGGLYYAELLNAIVKGAVSYHYSDPINNSYGIPVNKQTLTFNQSDTKGFRAKDLGIISGFELNLNMAGFFVRYELGLSNIFDDENITGKFNNSTLQGRINFRLKRLNN